MSGLSTGILDALNKTAQRTPYTYENVGIKSYSGMSPTSQRLFEAYNPPSATIPQNNPYKTIDNYTDRLNAVGVEAPERKSGALTNGLMTVLDVIQRPQYAVTNVLQDLTDNKKDSIGDVLKGALQGISGERKSSFSHTLNNLGLEREANPDGKWYNPLSWKLQNVLFDTATFAGDVLLDPTTYLSGGASVIAKGGSKTLTKGVAELAQKSVQGSADELVGKISMALGKSAEDVTQALTKHGNQSDAVMRMVSAFADADSGMAEHILNKGFKGINKDVTAKINEAFGTQLEQLTKLDTGKRLSTILVDGVEQVIDAPSLAASMDGSMGSLFGKALKDPDVDLVGRLKGAFDPGQSQFKNILKYGDTLDDIIKHFDATRMTDFTPTDKVDIFKQIFDVEYLAPEYGEALVSSEIGVLKTLYEAFDISAPKALSATERIHAAMKLDSGAYKSVEKLTDTLHQRMDIAKRAVKIEDGIEFSNGIQRVFDKEAGRFFVRYHNPFTGTVKPILELTNVVKNDKMRKAVDYVVSGNIIGGVAGKAVKTATHTVADTIGFLFEPEYVRQAFKGAGDKYTALKDFAKNITAYKHFESSLYKKSLEAATGLFMEDTEFLKSDKLQRAVVYFLEKDNDMYSKAAWSAIEGTDTTMLPDHVLTALEEMNTSGFISKYKELKLTPQEMEKVKWAAGKVALFNESILGFDVTRNVAFDAAPENLVKNTSSYVRHYTKPSALKNEEQLTSMYRDTQHSKVAKRTSTTSGSAQERTFSSIALREFKGGLESVDDIFTAMALRNHESLQVDLNKNLLKFLKDMSETPELGDMISFRKMSDSQIQRIVGNREIFVHKDILAQLNRITKNFETDEGKENIIKFVDTLTNTLKMFQTSLNPSFIIKNAIGEPMMNFFGDVTVESHGLAAEIMKDNSAKHLVKIGDTVFINGAPGFRPALVKGAHTEGVYEVAHKGAKTWEDSSYVFTKDPVMERSFMEDITSKNDIKTYQVGPHKMTARDIMQKFNEMGLGWSGISKGNLIQDTRTLVKKELARDTQSGGLGRIGTMASEAGDFVETWTRLSMFIDRLEKGFDFDTAAAEVRLFHVDYRDLTNVESTFMRRIMPYYTYMRKNLPIQMRTLYNSYGKVGMVAKLVDQSYSVINSNFGGEVATDDYLKEGMALPIDVDSEGNVQYLNWGMPLADLSRLQYDMTDFIEKNVTDMTHPMLKMLFETVSNSSIGFGQPIEKYEGERAPLLPNWENSPDGLPKKVDYVVQQFGVVDSIRKALGQGISQATGEPEDPLKPRNAAAYLGIASALPLRNQYNTQNNQAYEHRDQLYEYIQLLKSQGIEVPSYTPAESESPLAQMYKNRSKYTP